MARPRKALAAEGMAFQVSQVSQPVTLHAPLPRPGAPRTHETLPSPRPGSSAQSPNPAIRILPILRARPGTTTVRSDACDCATAAAARCCPQSHASERTVVVPGRARRIGSIRIAGFGDWADDPGRGDGSVSCVRGAPGRGSGACSVTGWETWLT